MELIVYSLENCFYSMSASNLLDEENISYNLKSVSHQNKNIYKEKNNMKTFPQIFLQNKDVNIKIGGYSDLSYINNLIKNNNNFDEVKNNLLKKFNLSLKEVLLIISHFRK
tara:strand:- start:151 stop:483 length:333 start_codon:yes stop_codon:yes gene_type:complete